MSDVNKFALSSVLKLLQDYRFFFSVFQETHPGNKVTSTIESIDNLLVNLKDTASAKLMEYSKNHDNKVTLSKDHLGLIKEFIISMQLLNKKVSNPNINAMISKLGDIIDSIYDYPFFTIDSEEASALQVQILEIENS